LRVNKRILEARFTAIFQDNQSKPVSECLHSGFCWSWR